MPNGSRPGRPAPRSGRLGPLPSRSGPGPEGCLLPHDPCPTAGRSRGNLTSDGSRRQRTPSWGSEHPGVAGSREEGPRGARNELCNRQGPQPGRRRRPAALPPPAPGRRRRPEAHWPPAPTWDAANAARRRRRHLTSGQASIEARRTCGRGGRQDERSCAGGRGRLRRRPGGAFWARLSAPYAERGRGAPETGIAPFPPVLPGLTLPSLGLGAPALPSPVPGGAYTRGSVVAWTRPTAVRLHTKAVEGCRRANG